MAFGHWAQRLDGVENACGGLAVNRRHMGDGRIGGQEGVEGLRCRRGVFGRAQDCVGDPGVLEHEDHALAVSPVGQHGHFTFGRDGALEHRLNTEGAAALHQNGFPAGLSGNTAQSKDGLTHLGHQAVELPVPGTGVVKHGLLDRERGGQRSGGEQQGVLGSGQFRRHGGLEWCPGNSPAANESFHQKGGINQFPRASALGLRPRAPRRSPIRRRGRWIPRGLETAG